MIQTISLMVALVGGDTALVQRLVRLPVPPGVEVSVTVCAEAAFAEAGNSGGGAPAESAAVTMHKAPAPAGICPKSTALGAAVAAAEVALPRAGAPAVTEKGVAVTHAAPEAAAPLAPGGGAAGTPAPDIFIYCGVPQRLPAPAAKGACAPFYVLCAAPAEVERLGEALSAFTELWPAPLTDAVLALCYGRLLREAQSRCALDTTRIWLDTLINSVPDLIWFKDARGSHLKVNAAFGRAVGKTPQMCEGRGHYYIWDLEPDEYATGEYVCLETEEEVLRRRETCLFDERVKSKSGLRQFKTYKSPLFSPRGELFGTVGIAKDVTDLQNIGRELELILASVPFGTLIVDEDGSIINMNPKFEEYFGVTSEEFSPLGYAEICETVFDVPQEMLAEGKEIEILSNRGRKPSVYMLREQKISDIFGSEVGRFVICIDVTTENELRRRLLHSANTDFLTGLHNRRYFYEALTLRSGLGPVSLVYFDLDYFKTVNDTYGHQVGDQALVLMAKLLREAFPNDLATRLGGDEFIIARFGGCAAEELRAVVEAFMDKARKEFLAQPQFHELSLSAGIAHGENSAKSVDALIACADAALYLAKTRGKACCAFYGESEEAARVAPERLHT